MLPDELRPIWISYFEIIQEIGKIKFQRARLNFKEQFPVCIAQY